MADHVRGQRGSFPLTKVSPLQDKGSASAPTLGAWLVTQGQMIKSVFRLQEGRLPSSEASTNILQPYCNRASMAAYAMDVPRPMKM